MNNLPILDEVWLIVWLDAGGQLRITGLPTKEEADRVLRNMRAAAFPNETLPEQVSGPFRPGVVDSGIRLAVS